MRAVSACCTVTYRRVQLRWKVQACLRAVQCGPPAAVAQLARLVRAGGGARGHIGHEGAPAGEGRGGCKAGGQQAMLGRRSRALGGPPGALPPPSAAWLHHAQHRPDGGKCGFDCTSPPQPASRCRLPRCLEVSPPGRPISRGNQQKGLQGHQARAAGKQSAARRRASKPPARRGAAVVAGKVQQIAGRQAAHLWVFTSASTVGLPRESYTWRQGTRATRLLIKRLSWPRCRPAGLRLAGQLGLQP